MAAVLAPVSQTPSTAPAPIAQALGQFVADLGYDAIPRNVRDLALTLDGGMDARDIADGLAARG